MITGGLLNGLLVWAFTACKSPHPQKVKPPNAFAEVLKNALLLFIRVSLFNDSNHSSYLLLNSLNLPLY